MTTTGRDRNRPRFSALINVLFNQGRSYAEDSQLLEDAEDYTICSETVVGVWITVSAPAVMSSVVLSGLLP